MATFPKRLASGDTVRIICPSDSLRPQDRAKHEVAAAVLESLGLQVELAAHCYDNDGQGRAAVDKRLDDLHQAFADKTVRLVMAGTGGFDSALLLDRIDYDLIRRNPKFFCGYSDITNLLQAITAQTDLTTYHTTNFNGLAGTFGRDFTLTYLQKILFSTHAFTAVTAKTWFDKTYSAQHPDGLEKRYRNTGWWGVQSAGIVEGRLAGGNIGCLLQLAATGYIPHYKQTILAIETDQTVNAHDFELQLRLLLQTKAFAEPEAIVIGRFQKASGLNRSELEALIAAIPQLRHIPIIANIDFGHTKPQLTLPIGGLVQVHALPERLAIKIIEH